jgi:parvulin-like peptidyl-prolyl isomerase
VRNLLCLALIAALVACQKDNTSPAPGAGSGSGSAAMKPPVAPPIPPGIDIDSKDILARKDTADSVDVKHVLLSWRELGPIYRGKQDPRGAGRSNDDAAKMAKDVLDKLTKDPTQIDALIKDLGEDPGMKAGDPYTVNAKTGFVPEFKNLALRLKVNEAGIVKTQFGYHVIERIPPPPPDPLESADILARPPVDETVFVLNVTIGWKDAPIAKQGRPVDPRAQNRTKEEADKLAKDTLDKINKGEDLEKLIKDVSEFPGAKEDADRPIEMTKDSQFPLETFKNLSLRLKLGEAGLVRSPFGWHVIKRVPPPPPDPLNSKDILDRKPVTDKAKVKHILLGWDKVHAKDPRGIKRTRAELDKLVGETVAKLKKGDKIEPLMADLSEDPGSAKSGTSYDVSPTAQLVDPFKNLSLRLNVNEVGVVKSDFGIHIIQRVE